MAAACVLVLLALTAGTLALPLPAAVTAAVQFVLIVVAALVGSRVRRHRDR